MIHLKERNKTGPDRKFAVLVEPSKGTITSDEELYKAVKAYGKAVIAEYQGAGVTVKGQLRIVYPEAFELIWQGD